MTKGPSGKRIVLTGASGVGKTSLAQLLAETLQLDLIPEVSRQLCHQMGYQSPTAIPDQQEFRTTVLQKQVEQEAALPRFISDRGTIDCWVMWQRWQMCSAMTYDSEAYYESCRTNASLYTHIVYIPPLFTPTEDEFRWTDADYIKQVDRLTRLTLYDWSLLDRTFIIKSTGLPDRVNEVCSWLWSNG